MHRYVVSHIAGSSDVNRLLQVTNKNELLERAKLAFGVTGNYALEAFSDEFGLYVRLDAMSEAPDGGRLRLVELPSLARPVTPARTSETVPVLTLQPTGPLSEVQGTHTLIHGEELHVLMSQSEDGQLSPSRQQLSEAGDETATLQSESETVDGDSQPAGDGNRKVDIPASPCSVLNVDLLSCVTRERLLAGQPLGFPELRDVYQGVYETYRRENSHSYPTNYREVAHKLMRSFPQIQHCLNMSEATAMETVLTKLRTKFRNERKKRPASPAQSQAKKAKTSKQHKIEGLPNFAPAPAGGSSMDMEKKLNRLRFEQDMEEGEREVLLAETLPARRRAILDRGNKMMPMAKLKMLFPFMFGESQLWREMALLVSEPVRTKYDAKLGAALERLSAECGCPRDMAAETLIRLLREEEGVISETPARGPTIVREDDCSLLVVIEGTEVATCASLQSAMLCLAISTYIFNQAVPKAIKGFMWLMAQKVMGLPADTKPTTEAVELRNLFLS